MPVVFLTISFFQREANSSMDTKSESLFILIFILMIGFLTGSGFFLLVGIFDTRFSDLLVATGVLFLLGFFMMFAIFLYFLVRSLDPEYKRHW